MSTLLSDTEDRDGSFVDNTNFLFFNLLLNLLSERDPVGDFDLDVRAYDLKLTLFDVIEVSLGHVLLSSHLLNVTVLE